MKKTVPQGNWSGGKPQPIHISKPHRPVRRAEETAVRLPRWQDPHVSQEVLLSQRSYRYNVYADPNMRGAQRRRP